MPLIQMRNSYSVFQVLKSSVDALIEFIQLEGDGELIGDVPAYHAKINQEPNYHSRELLIRRRYVKSLTVEAAIAKIQVGDEWFSVNTIRDISMLKATEQKLIKSHKLLEERVCVRMFALTNQINHRN